MTSIIEEKVTFEYSSLSLPSGQLSVQQSRISALLHLPSETQHAKTCQGEQAVCRIFDDSSMSSLESKSDVSIGKVIGKAGVWKRISHSIGAFHC